MSASPVAPALTKLSPVAPAGTVSVKRSSAPVAPHRLPAAVPLASAPPVLVQPPPPPPSSPSSSEYSSLFTEPLAPLILLLLAPLTSALVTCAGVAVGLVARYSAATPATRGEGLEVPLMVLVAVLLVDQVEEMSEPGAKMAM